MLRSALIATQFLTRLPIPFDGHWTMADLRDSVHLFPLVGALVGLMASLVYAAAVLINLPPILAALLAVSALTLITGGLHEDGLADVADGFGGGRTVDDKLRIMRDSRLGTFGGIALVLSLGARIGAIATLAAIEMVVAGLIVSAALSRAAMPVAMLLMTQARTDGLAASAGRPKSSLTFLGLGIGVALAFLCLPPAAAAIALIGCVVGSGAYLGLAKRQIGGISGDVLGGLQQVLDILCLFAIVATTHHQA